MKTMNASRLLDQLQSDVRHIIAQSLLLKQESVSTLLQQPSPGKWSVAQILEHLNSYGRYYLVKMEQSMAANNPAQEEFVPGWLGDFFTKMMEPDEAGMVTKKMSAPKDHRPVHALDALKVLNEFIDQQYVLLDLLEMAKEKNIGKIRIPISLTRIIKLKLGDTFRFLIGHERRHFIQVSNALSVIRTTIEDKYPASLQAG